MVVPFTAILNLPMGFQVLRHLSQMFLGDGNVFSYSYSFIILQVEMGDIWTWIDLILFTNVFFNSTLFILAFGAFYLLKTFEEIFLILVNFLSWYFDLVFFDATPKIFLGSL